jgi:hypothetical protein
MMRKALADPIIGPQILDLFAQMVRSLGGHIDEDLLSGAKRNLPMFAYTTQALPPSSQPPIEHVCEDLSRFDTLPEHDIMVTSPVCRGYSSAGRRDP